MSKNIKKFQIQSVIYNNKKEDLIKSIKALKQAVIVYNKEEVAEVKLVYGDASKRPVLVEEDIKKINSLLEGIIKFEYIFFGYNTGTAKGHNILLNDSTADYILIMNPDIIMEVSCLKKLIAPFDESDVGMTEARQTPLEHGKEYDINTGETEWASTACAAFRKNIYDQIGGFDDKTFFMYCDDLDFSWRIRKAGYKIKYVPSAIVYHSKKLSVDAKWLPTQAEIYYSAEASILLAYKWSDIERVEYLEETFAISECEEERKAVEEFRRRKIKGELPICIDQNHTIARFNGDDYCKMRFTIGGND